MTFYENLFTFAIDAKSHAKLEIWATIHDWLFEEVEKFITGLKTQTEVTVLVVLCSEGYKPTPRLQALSLGRCIK